MKKKFNLTIRLGAVHDSVTVDGVTFDRSKMVGTDKSKLRRLVTQAFAQASGVRWGGDAVPGYMRNANSKDNAKRDAARNAPAYRRSSRQSHGFENRVGA